MVSGESLTLNFKISDGQEMSCQVSDILHLALAKIYLTSISVVQARSRYHICQVLDSPEARPYASGRGTFQTYSPSHRLISVTFRLSLLMVKQ